MSYQQHFGEESKNYLQFRPSYPPELFSYLATITTLHERAWDCATGNGQAASELAKYFKQVIATDINQAQLEVAIPKPNIIYLKNPAEKTTIEDHSINLITVAQALHWFNLEEFYSEAKRVAADKAIIAVWCYSLPKITITIDSIISKLYYDILGNQYWPKERNYIDESYQTIPFPFEKLSTPQFQIQKQMNLEQLIGYLKTWSAVKEYQQQNNINPVDLINDALLHVWGNNPEQKIVWPIHLIAGKIT